MNNVIRQIIDRQP